MAIIFIEQIKKQKYLIWVFGIVILITVFVLWKGFLAKEKPPEVGVIPIPTKKIEINFEIFKNPLLEELQPIEKIIPEAGIEPGRENPFLPY
jgi:hypothetical protein